MMSLIGRSADGWIPSLAYLPLPQMKTLQQRIDDAAGQAGRDPASIRRILNIGGHITNGNSAGLLNGPAEQWAEELTVLTLEYGIDTYILAERDLRQVQRFAEEVVPRLRELVAQSRITTKEPHDPPL